MIWIFGFGPIGKEYLLNIPERSYPITIVTNNTPDLKNKNKNDNINFINFSEIDYDVKNSIVIIAVPVLNNLLIFQKINFCNCRIYIEKPLGYTQNYILKIKSLINISNTIHICLNRRFYFYTRELKEFLRNNKVNRIFINYNERIKFLTHKFNYTEISNWVFHNGIHLFDLIEFLMNDGFKFKDKKKLINGGYIVNGMIGKTEFIVNVTFDTFATFRVEFQGEDFSIVLDPIEKITINSNKNIKFSNEICINKPGFERMINDIICEVNTNFASINDILKINKKLIFLNDLLIEYLNEK